MPIISAIVLPRRIAPARSLLQALRRLVRWCLLCHARASQRRHLADLDERMLKDVGITPPEAVRECAKPWWRG